MGHILAMGGIGGRARRKEGARGSREGCVLTVVTGSA